MAGKPHHGMSKTRLYRIWDNMRGRTTRPHNTYYHNYGGRGITLCREWRTFIPFMEWALSSGYREDLTLERIDNNGPYSSDNCRWATRKEQDRNKRRNVWIDYNGERICQADLAERLGVHHSTIYSRLKAGKLKPWRDTPMEKKLRRHADICAELHAIYDRKNRDYGDAFHLSYLEEGMAMPRIRLGDKFNRFKNLSKNPEAQAVNGESIRDTLLDLANYAIMTVIEMEATEK